MLGRGSLTHQQVSTGLAALSFNIKSVMPANINGSSLADLVKKQVEQEVTQLHQLLLGAMARITCLENELSNTKAERSSPRPPSTSTSSSQLCRHWLKSRCTWKERCRFSHGSDADSEGSIAAINAKDQMGTRPTPSSSCEVKMHDAENTEMLIDFESNLPPPRPHSITGVLQSDVKDDALPEDLIDDIIAKDLIDDNIAKIADKAAMHQQEEEKNLHMATVVDTIQATYMAKYQPKQGDGMVHSAEVAVPFIDFSKVKPHLHRKLPQPSRCSVQGCHPDPASDEPDAKRCKCCHAPFGCLPGFYTSLGVVAVPKDPIGGYVYAGGTGDNTVWQLHADAIYI